MKITKTEKGITLIALIITILVLLILAVVAIKSVQNEGIIAHTQNATGTYNNAVANEQQQLENYLAFLICKGNHTDENNDGVCDDCGTNFKEDDETEECQHTGEKYKTYQNNGTTGHTYSEYCSVCNQCIDTKTENHYDSNSDGTCDGGDCGYVFPCNHDWSGGFGYCGNCGEECPGHQWNDWRLVSQDDGGGHNIQRDCKICGYNEETWGEHRDADGDGDLLCDEPLCRYEIEHYHDIGKSINEDYYDEKGHYYSEYCKNADCNYGEGDYYESHDYSESDWRCAKCNWTHTCSLNSVESSDSSGHVLTCSCGQGILREGFTHDWDGTGGCSMEGCDYVCSNHEDEDNDGYCDLCTCYGGWNV